MVQALHRVEDRIKGPGAARSYEDLRAGLRWLSRQGFLPTNVTEGIDVQYSAPARTRYLSVTELRKLWEAAGVIGWPYGSALRLLAVTGCRRGEISNLRSEWVSETGIEFPKEATKQGRPHWVPLTAGARELLLSPAGGIIEGPIWGRAKGLTGWSKIKAQLDATLGFNAPWTLHDIRRSAATLLAGEGFLPHHIEAFLGHAVAGDGLIAVYQRAECIEERTEMAHTLWQALKSQDPHSP